MCGKGPWEGCNPASSLWSAARSDQVALSCFQSGNSFMSCPTVCLTLQEEHPLISSLTCYHSFCPLSSFSFVFLPCVLGRAWVCSLNKLLAGGCYESPKPLLLQKNNSSLSQGPVLWLCWWLQAFGTYFYVLSVSFFFLEGHKTGHSAVGMVCCVLGGGENPFLPSFGCASFGVYPCGGLERKGSVNWRPKQEL